MLKGLSFNKTNFQRSVIRTIVPIVMAFLVSIGAGEVISESVVADAVGASVSVVYYVVIRKLEENGHPGAGILIGSKGNPSYEEPFEEVELPLRDKLTEYIAEQGRG